MKLQVLPVGPPGPALYRGRRLSLGRRDRQRGLQLLASSSFFLLSDAVVLSLLFD